MKGKKLRIASALILTTLAAGFVFLFVLPKWATRASLTKVLTELEHPPSNPSLEFRDAGGQPFDAHDFDNKIHSNIRLKDVDPEFIRDLLAVEDRDFREHSGVDPGATLKAFGNFVLAPAAAVFGGKSGPRRGGSTITQQLIKNVLNHRRRTPWIKLQEIHLAWDVHAGLKKRLGGRTRDIILEQYLNRLYITDRIRGIKNAARIFLGRSNIERLAPEERRLLLAVLHAPSLFQKGGLKRRRKILRVIELRLRAGGRRPEAMGRKIHSAFMGAPGALKRRDEIRRVPRRIAATNLAASYLHVFKPDNKTTGVRTHRLSELDIAMNKRLLKYLGRINEDNRGGCAKTGAFILLRIRDGAVIAAGDSPCDEYNETVMLRRQIHSTFKPILYATAFMELNVNPATIYTDKRVTYRDDLGRPYSPGNNYRIFKGPITLKRALQFSTNTISLQLLNGFSTHTLVGRSLESFALFPHERLRHQFHHQPSLALGTVHLSPAHLAAAYLTLLSGGVKKYPVWVRPSSVPGREAPGSFAGGTRNTLPRRVLQRTASYQVREMLTAVVRLRGTGGRHLQHIHSLIIKDLGGKSGSGPRESWFAGFSQDLLLVVWVGYRHRLTAASKNFSAIPLWKRLFLETIPLFPPRALKHPPDLKRVYYCKHSGEALTRHCPRLESALFKPGTGPTQKCRLHGKSGRRR